MNLEMTSIIEKIKSANLSKEATDLLTKIYSAKYLEVHELASSLDLISKGEEYTCSDNVRSLVKEVCDFSQASMLGVVKFMADFAEECGISLSAAPQAAQDSGEAAAEVEQTSFQVQITNLDGMEKINAVKYLKGLLSIDLKAASALLDPNDLKTIPGTFDKAKADEIVSELANCKVLAKRV